MKKTEIQKEILRLMLHENREHYTLKSTYLLYVWYYCQKGSFLYNDKVVDANEIQPLIELGILKYVGHHNHQGESMVRYQLSYNYIENGIN